MPLCAPNDESSHELKYTQTDRHIHIYTFRRFQYFFCSRISWVRQMIANAMEKLQFCITHRTANEKKIYGFFACALSLSLSFSPAFATDNRFFVWHTLHSRYSHTVIGPHDGSSFALFRFHVNCRCWVRMLARSIRKLVVYYYIEFDYRCAARNSHSPRQTRRWLIHDAATQMFVRISHRLNCVQGGLEGQTRNCSLKHRARKKTRKNFKFRRWLRFHRDIKNGYF